jgi:hypothetical protein
MMKLYPAMFRNSVLGAIALALMLPVPGQAQTLQDLAQQYVDQNWTINPLANLAGDGCRSALVDTPFEPNVRNCNQFRSFAYAYWQAVYGTPGLR